MKMKLKVILTKEKYKMAMANSKSLKTTIKIFFKENARDPDFNEFRNLMLGRATKEKKVVKTDEEKTK